MLLTAIADHIIGGSAGWGGRPHGSPEPPTPDASLTAQSTGPDRTLDQNLAQTLDRTLNPLPPAAQAPPAAVAGAAASLGVCGSNRRLGGALGSCPQETLARPQNQGMQAPQPARRQGRAPPKPPQGCHSTAAAAAAAAGAGESQSFGMTPG